MTSDRVLEGTADPGEAPASVRLVVNVPGRLIGFGKPGVVQFEHQSLLLLDSTTLPEVALYDAAITDARTAIMEVLVRELGPKRHVLRNPSVTWQTDFIVLRLAPEISRREQFNAWFELGHEGMWYHRAQFPTVFHERSGPAIAQWKAHPSERYEIRADGAAAQVYEIRPAA